MRLNKPIIELLFILLIPMTIFSQKTVYTLDDAVYKALENNKDIKIALLDIKKGEAAVSEAFGYALPSVDLTASLSHFIKKPMMAFPDFASMLGNATYSILFDEGVLPRDEDKFLPMGSKLQSFAQTNSFESTVQVTQILFNSAVFRGIGASQIYLDLSKENLKAVTSKTLLDVNTAFYGTLLAKELLTILESSLKNAEDNLSNVKALYNQGLVSEYDLLQVEVQVENLRPKVIDLQKAVFEAKSGLKLLLGIDQNTEIDITGKITYDEAILPEEEILINQAVTRNFELNTLKIKRNVDEEMIAIERADYWPMLTAFGNYSYAGSSDDWKFNTYNSSIVGLSFSMNLFRGTRTARKVEQAVIATKQTDERLALTQEFLTKEVKSKLIELTQVRSQINAIERNVKLAEKAYSIANTRYKEGTGTQLEIKNADLELSTAKVNRIQSIYDYKIAISNLEQLTGNLDDKYIDYVNKNLK
ncbi:MAG: TolC family protein [Melioribacteraceae bacterium]|nr:TolC family protein [Melioribacteraceae bacterium]